MFLKVFTGMGELRQPGLEGTGTHKKGSSLKWVKFLCHTFALEPLSNIGVVPHKKLSLVEGS